MNSMNKKDRLHRIGSKPYRQVAWELGAKTINEQSLLQMLHETHKKDTEFATLGIGPKYDEIRDVMEIGPSLSQMQALRMHLVAEKTFKSKSRSQGEIQDVMEDPSLPQMEVAVLENIRLIAIVAKKFFKSKSRSQVAEKVFKSKSRSQVLGLGGGVRPKDELEKGAKTGNEQSLLQMPHETRKKDNEFATPEIAQKYVAKKFFKPKYQSQVLGLGGGVRPQNMKLTVDAKLLVYILLVYELTGTSST
ncbi:hypothetical protein Cgig2_004328 [Carnegiea gigantea]|uniref:Uncharacterized protein n=1 Tax=Carnegiea gigantea TaxID=171969 RepID=A0A9Q1JXJ2_9CARY|nr:hypothetical protein Cgig2_004328 [Carnegiea gigantea]